MENTDFLNKGDIFIFLTFVNANDGWTGVKTGRELEFQRKKPSLSISSSEFLKKIHTYRWKS